VLVPLEHPALLQEPLVPLVLVLLLEQELVLVQRELPVLVLLGRLGLAELLCLAVVPMVLVRLLLRPYSSNLL